MISTELLRGGDRLQLREFIEGLQAVLKDSELAAIQLLSTADDEVLCLSVFSSTDPRQILCTASFYQGGGARIARGAPVFRRETMIGWSEAAKQLISVLLEEAHHQVERVEKIRTVINLLEGDSPRPVAARNRKRRTSLAGA